jgi:sn-glycerol 3-phosphate transport system substrate-binding protein
MIRFLLLTFLLGSSFAQAQQLLLRHKLEGTALNVLGTLVVRFNDEQKGKGMVRLQSLPAPEDRRVLPQLALLDTSDSREFFDTLPRFVPLHELMKSGGEKLDAQDVLPQIRDAIDDAAGRLQALPLALSLPVLYLNRDMLQKAGADPDQIPRTWLDLQAMAGKLYDSGVQCPLTSSDFSWVHLENLASQHNQPITLRSRTTEKLLVNSMVNIKHLALLASWQKSHYFHYSGGGREGDARFLSGECAMLTGDSSLYAEALERRLDVAILALPYYDDVYGAKPSEILPDGASLWALAGMKKDELRLAAKFMRFLLQPSVQREWVRSTTYLPMSAGAIIALREAQAFPAELLDAAQRRLAIPSKNSTRPRSGAAREKLRAILGEEVQPMWTGDRPAKEALDRTVQRANALGAPLIKPR